jgi:hypothetical protein
MKRTEILSFPSLPLAPISSKMFDLCDNPVQTCFDFLLLPGKAFSTAAIPPPLPLPLGILISRVSLCLLSDTLTPLVIMPLLKETLLNFFYFLLPCSFFFRSM